jgi:23S rRNA (uridine2552-2'-O)-methyltransferase
MPFTPTAPLLKKASKSSTLWLARQYKDPYVRARLSNPVNYRSRSAFKLIEVEGRFKFLSDFLKEAKRSTTTFDVSSNSKKIRRAKPRTFNVVDLGAAPGGWSQVIAAKLGLAGDELDDDPSIHARRKPKSNMEDWKEEMSKRKKMSKVFDDHVEEEIADMDQLVSNETDTNTNEWSTPPSSKGKRVFGLKKEASQTEYDSMDPLDYLNSRDLDQPSTSASSAKKPTLPINVIALDILAMKPLAGVHTMQMDFLSPEAPNAVMSVLAKLNEKHSGKGTSYIFFMLMGLQAHSRTNP